MVGELNCCFGSRDDRYISSIDPHAVVNKFAFLFASLLTAHQLKLQQLQKNIAMFVCLQMYVISFSDKIKLK